MNEWVTTLHGKPSKTDKLILRGEEIINRIFSYGWYMSFTPSFPKSIICCSPMLKAILLEDVYVKQEHLIAMTKIKHLNQTLVVFKKLNNFPEPAIFTEAWNLALKIGWAVSSGCGMGANHTGSSHRNTLIQREIRQSEQKQPQKSLSCQENRYGKSTWSTAWTRW